MMNQIVIVVAAALIVAIPSALLVRWFIKQRRDYKQWLRLTDGQEATEL